jgi:hypothetical protein
LVVGGNAETQWHPFSVCRGSFVYLFFLLLLLLICQAEHSSQK